MWGWRPRRTKRGLGKPAAAEGKPEPPWDRRLAGSQWGLAEGFKDLQQLAWNRQGEAEQ